MANDSTETRLTERICQRMKALDLSHADVASACGVTEVSVRNWTKSADGMSARYLRPLARVLKCSIDYLLGASNTLDSEPAKAR